MMDIAISECRQSSPHSPHTASTNVCALYLLLHVAEHVMDALDERQKPDPHVAQAAAPFDSRVASDLHLREHSGCDVRLLMRSTGLRHIEHGNTTGCLGGFVGRGSGIAYCSGCASTFAAPHESLQNLLRPGGAIEPQKSHETGSRGFFRR